MYENVNVNIICPNKNIEIKEAIPGQMEGPARCSYNEDSNFNIWLNSGKIAQLYKKIWLKKVIDVKTFRLGFIIHELAHVRYSDMENFDYNILSKFEKYINNIIEDARIENLLSFEFPDYAKYFTFLLSSVKQDIIGITKNVPNILKSNTKDNMNKLTNDVYMLARFNIVNEDADIKFINKILPLICLAKRAKDFHECVSASVIISRIIKEELIEKEENKKLSDGQKSNMYSKEVIKNEIGNGMNNIIVEQKAINAAEINEISKKLSGESKKQFKEKAKQTIQKASNTKAQIENRERSGFFLEVIEKYSKEINIIRGIFLKAFTSYKQVGAYDGDINLMKQQSAYLGSITMDETKDYQYSKKELVKLDVALVRDVSGSTQNFEKDYAKAIIILLCALENIDGIRTAQVDFNTFSKENKSFETEIDKAIIKPHSSGGTTIRGAYDKVLSYDFKGKKNLVFVITDGDFFDSKTEMMEQEKQIEKTAKIVKIAIGGYTKPGLINSSIEELPKTIADIIVKEIV